MKKMLLIFGAISILAISGCKKIVNVVPGPLISNLSVTTQSGQIQTVEIAFVSKDFHSEAAVFEIRLSGIPSDIPNEYELIYRGTVGIPPNQETVVNVSLEMIDDYVTSNGGVLESAPNSYISVGVNTDYAIRDDYLGDNYKYCETTCNYFEPVTEFNVYHARSLDIGNSHLVKFTKNVSEHWLVAAPDTPGSAFSVCIFESADLDILDYGNAGTYLDYAVGGTDTIVIANETTPSDIGKTRFGKIDLITDPGSEIDYRLAVWDT